MANRIIPELDEIDIGDVTSSQLMVLDTGLETFKIRLETIQAFLFGSSRAVVSVVYSGSETGEKTVDVSTYVADATVMIWMLKKPTAVTDAEQLTAMIIKTPDEETVVIDSGDFALAAGTYTLIGV